MNNSFYREIKLLDVTLREAPLFNYGVSNIEKSIEYLEDAGVDMIELGFLGNSNDFSYKLGYTHVNNIKQANSFIKRKKSGVLYTVCMNGGSYDINLLDNYEKGVDAIRYVLMEGKIDDEINDLMAIKEKGYKLMVQHRNIMHYTDDEIKYIVSIINEVNPYAYSVVDTHGSIYPQDLKHLYDIVADILAPSIFLGFHGHDNHKLATANAMTFLEMTRMRDKVFVDGSVMGIGIGAGNANTELLALYLNKYEKKRYNIQKIYDMMDTVLPDLSKRCDWGYSGACLITGEYNCLFTHGSYLLDNLKKPTLKNLDSIIKELPHEEKYNPQEAYLLEKYENLFKEEKRWHKLLRKVGHLKLFEPLKKLYIRLGFK